MTMGSVWRGALAAALFVALAGNAGCKRELRAGDTPFPASNEVAGWVKTGDIRTFAAADMWKYIDGDAEKYLKAGVQTVSTADYKFQGKVEAVVDIYIMSNAEGAKNVFESEPMGKFKQAAVGDAARSSAQSLLFVRGPYLVRIVAYQEAPETQSAILQLGLGVQERLAK